ncbi:hypothetical protein MTO96_024440 [Rhipicephalus appendiculatus]
MSMSDSQERAMIAVVISPVAIAVARFDGFESTVASAAPWTAAVECDDETMTPRWEPFAFSSCVTPCTATEHST